MARLLPERIICRSLNERLALGSEADAFAAKVCFNPEAAAAVDDYLLEVARKRRKGEFVV